LICTLGDLLLDVVVRLEAPIAEDTDAYGHTRVGAGGQAANVAAWVAALGGRARFIGKRARDPAGRLVRDELVRRGVEVAGPEVEAGTGTVVSVATPDGKRTMLSDRGVSPELAPDELDEAWLDGCECLHVPVYSLARGPLRETTLRAVHRAPRVSLDLSAAVALEQAGVELVEELLQDVPMSVVFGTEEELQLLGPVRAETVAVKRGARGCLVRTGSGSRELPAEPAEVVDTTGAGDAFAAGFLVGGPELAVRAAARCVEKMGAMP
jgi:ribokinase